MPAPIPAGARYAGRTQIFTGSHGGTCGNCGRGWGGHNGIACEWQDVELRCALCSRRTGDHRQGQCEVSREQFTLPVEFVELWGEIGKAHAADICFQKYTPKTWPNKTLRKAKESGLSLRARTEDGEPYRFVDESYQVSPAVFREITRTVEPSQSGTFVGRSPFAELRWTGPQYPRPEPPPIWSLDDDAPF